MGYRDSGWVPGAVMDQNDARLATGVLAMAGAGPIQSRSGIKPAGGSPGLVQQTGTASSSVLVNAMQATIQATRATSGGPYLATMDAQLTLDILSAHPADATNTRNDLVIARQMDIQWSDATTNFVVQQVVGTPSGSPVDPTPTPGDYVVLARIVIPKLSITGTSVTSAMITNLSPWAVAAGGILPVLSQADRDALTKCVGLTVWRLDTTPQRMETWDTSSGSWVVTGPQPVPQYASDEGGSRTVASAGSFLDFTGQPSLSVVVPASGRLKVEWGFNGYNDTSASATIRVAPAMSGANSYTPTTAATAVTGAQSSTLPNSASRTKLFTALTPGSTTIKLQGRSSSGTTAQHSIGDSWLYVEPQA
jgi:hypothetical protein